MKILSVDDDEFILEILQGALLEAGFPDVTTAASGAVAVHEIENSPIAYDCFFLDIQMPGMNGIELCERIRQMPIYCKTPIIMLTAMSERDYIDRAFRSGASDYVTKPFDVLELGTRARMAERLNNEIARTKEHHNTLNHLTREILETRKINIADAVNVKDVNGFLDKASFENYVATLSRSRYYSSNLVALKIENIKLLHRYCNASEFEFAIADISEAISDNLAFNSGFFSYFGDGVFVCIYDRVKETLVDDFEMRIQDTVARMDLVYQGGLKLEISLRCGPHVNSGLFSKWGSTEVIERAINGLSHRVTFSEHRNLPKIEIDFRKGNKSWFKSAAFGKRRKS